MAEDIEAGGEPEIEGGDSGELASAQEAFSRAAEAQGVPEAEAEADRGTGAVPTRETSAPVSTYPTPQTPAQENRRNREWAEQQFREQRQQAADAHRQRLERRRIEEQERLLREVAEAQRQQGAPQAPADADPEPDRETDYWAWHEWDKRQLQKQLLEAFDERLQPLVQRDQQLAAWEAEQAEIRQRREAERGWFEEQATVAREAHQLYAQTEEGRDYMERVSWLAGVPGDEQRADGAFSLAFQAAGFPTEKSREMGIGFVRGMQDWAVRQGLNPAAALDYFTRALVAAAGGFYAQGQAQGQQQAPAAPAPPKLRGSQNSVREMKRAAGSALNGSAASTGGAPQDLQGSIKALADAGELDNMAALRQLAARFQIQLPTLKKEISRVAAGAA
jgi:hypothetical protein